MRKLKPCPCGKTPDRLGIDPGNTSKYAWVWGDCCSEWSTEFRTDYLEVGDPKLMKLAIEAWNSLPRAFDLDEDTEPEE
jgi:hypothetical protein